MEHRQGIIFLSNFRVQYPKIHVHFKGEMQASGNRG